MGREMISLQASTNWKNKKIQKHKTYVWDIDEANRRIYNDISIHDGDIVECKKKRG